MLCWGNARGPRCARCTASRRRCRSAATGWRSTCPRPGPSRSPARRPRRSWRARSRARRPLPACRPAFITAWRRWPRTSKTIRRNTTRFAVIGDHAPPRTGNDRTAMLFQVEPSPRRLGRRDGDLQAEQAEPDVDRVVSGPRSGAGILIFCGDGRPPERRPTAPRRAALGRKTLRLEILGSFPAATPVE